MRNARYYYGIMPPEEKEAYKSIYNGLKTRLYEIVVPSVLVSAQIQYTCESCMITLCFILSIRQLLELLSNLDCTSCCRNIFIPQIKLQQ